MRCADLSGYFDGTLSGDVRASFEAHAETCVSCKNDIAAWNQVADAVRAAHPLPADPTSLEAQRIVVLARQRQTQTKRRPVWRPYLLAMTGAAAAVVAVLVVANASPEEVVTDPNPDALAHGVTAQVSLPLVVVSGRASSGAENVTAGSKLRAANDKPLVVKLGNDRIRVDGQVDVGSVTKRSTVLRVVGGTSVFAVAPRKTVGGSFSVLAGDHRVNVVGTLFSVTLNEDGSVQVAVDEGVVEVLQPRGEVMRLEAGQRFVGPGADQNRDGRRSGMRPEQRGRLRELLGYPTSTKRTSKHAASSKSQTKEADRFKEWRQWIANGNADAVELAMGDHFVKHPRDTQAWLVLAEARGAGQRWRRSVDAYDKVIALDRGRVGNAARLESAIILQERLGENATAVERVGKYLKQRFKPREPDALIVLAKAKNALGDADVALEVLRQIIVRHKSTPASVEARYLIQRWSR